MHALQTVFEKDVQGCDLYVPAPQVAQFAQSRFCVAEQSLVMYCVAEHVVHAEQVLSLYVLHALF